MINNETIVAIATPYGIGGIGIVRISGDNAKNVATKVFKPIGKRTIDNVKGFEAIYGRAFDDNGEFDEAVATVYNNPKSYTGEDVVELSCHGGSYIMERLLNSCLHKGARLAQPGEFTKRAFINGKLNLEQAESVIDLINAKSKLAATAAFSVKDGILSKKLDNIISKITSISAHLSVWTDYPEEDIEEVTTGELSKSLYEIQNDLKILLSSYDKGKIIREGVTTAIIGKPNVGKSTLMNTLSGQETSIVTHIAGTTRDVVEETVKIGDIVLRLADTAGIHNTKDIVESIGVKATLKRVDGSALIIAVFDGTTTLDEDDYQIIDLVKDRTVLAIINKSDLQSKIDKHYLFDNFKYIIEISAKNQLGMEMLSDKIKEIYNLNNFDVGYPMLYTLRQKNCVERGYNSIIEAINTLEIGMTFDAVNVCIEDALDCLLELSGKKTSEEVIHGVFSKFCVGK